MLYVIVSNQKEYRNTQVSKISETVPNAEFVRVDDSLIGVAELKGYVYPSLFATTPTVVHGKFMLDEGAVDAVFIKELAASPTIFILEELVLSVAQRTLFNKHGAVVYQDEKKTVPDKRPDLFKLVSAIAVSQKKDRWLAYQAVLEHHPIEAILGILYWKVRDLSLKGGTEWKKMYHNLLHAHMQAWKSGTPLELAIEKVLLST